MNSVPVVKVSFREKMLLAREDAILRAVNHLLAEKGFEAMTVDAVAASVGIAKASLYKHFASKEALAAAAMVAVVQRALAFIATLPAAAAPRDKLRAVVQWTLEQKLRGEMPSLPSQNSSLRATLRGNRRFMDGLLELSQVLKGWIEAGQAQGDLNPRVPAAVLLYTLYAKACEPMLEFLKLDGQYDDAQMVALVLTACFEGLNAC